MSKLEHVYFMFGSEHLEDYTAYTNYAGGYKDSQKYPIIANLAFKDELVKHVDQWCDASYTPKLGDEIHIVQESILPVQDLRNNFKIKRHFDGASCNVFFNVPENKGKAIKYHHWMIDRTKKIAVFLWEPERNKSYQEIWDELNALLPANINTEDFEHHHFQKITMYFMNISDSYYRLLSEKYATPCVFYEQLPLKRNELSADLLYMIYRQGSDFTTDYKQYILQLTALTQTNWKEYPYTMYHLFEEMLKYRGIHFNLGRWSDAAYPKQIRELMTYKLSLPKVVSEKDKKLMRDLSELIFNIGETKFVSLKSLISKLNSTGMNLLTFTEMYDTMVKIDLKSEKD